MYKELKRALSRSRLEPSTNMYDLPSLDTPLNMDFTGTPVALPDIPVGAGDQANLSQTDVMTLTEGSNIGWSPPFIGGHIPSSKDGPSQVVLY